MAYEFDQQARQEAADHPVSEGEIARLRLQSSRKAGELGTEGVRGHTATFSPESWAGLLEHLPPQIAGSGRITRGDVFDIAADVRAARARAAQLLTASFLWGSGPTPYGPRRYRDIIGAAQENLEPSL